MKIIRCTLFTTPGQYMTTVVRECDIQGDVSELLAGRHPESFLTHELFDMPEGTEVEAATMEALRRLGPRITIEQNMAVSFFWNAAHLMRTADHGVLVNPAPAPYSSGECREVLIQLHKHPNYKGQTLIQRSEDNRIVTLHPDGTVTAEKAR